MHCAKFGGSPQKASRYRRSRSSAAAIASTFWGRAWCDNLESYSDFSNRLPRGRTYVRNGSVVDLQIEPGKITSIVSGSSLYRIAIKIRPLAAPRWKKLKQQCGAGIGSVVELLQGRLSSSVMAVVTSHDSGLFPAPAEIEMSCSCPDWAGMCKHVAATLYGVGNRLDRQPELFFKLRQVDHLELIAEAGREAPKPKGARRKTIAKDQLANVFGIELETEGATADAQQRSPAKLPRSKKTAAPGKKQTVRADAGSAPEGSASGQRQACRIAAQDAHSGSEETHRGGAAKALAGSSAGTELSKDGNGTEPSAHRGKTSNSSPANPRATNPRARFAHCEWLSYGGLSCHRNT